jgi:type I site-specific restriction-modification system R (restriction) subunit
MHTFELKNSLRKQTVADAEEQYKRNRDPRERLFELGRWIAHFPADDAEVRFRTHLSQYCKTRASEYGRNRECSFNRQPHVQRARANCGNRLQSTPAV